MIYVIALSALIGFLAGRLKIKHYVQSKYGIEGPYSRLSAEKYAKYLTETGKSGKVISRWMHLA